MKNEQAIVSIVLATALTASLALSAGAVPYAADDGGGASAAIKLLAGERFPAGFGASLAAEKAFAVEKDAAQDAAVQGLATFEEAVKLVAVQGVEDAMAPDICAAIGIDSGGAPWPLREKSAVSTTIRKSMFVGNVGDVQTVVLVDQLRDNTEGTFYIADPSGALIRAYRFAAGQGGTPLALDEANAPFDLEKQFWMRWLPGHLAVAAQGE